MLTINARNVNDALPQGLALLHQHGVREDSRAGPVIRCPWPVTTEYRRPLERVLFAPWRDANPFFHIVEAMWLLAGRDDLASLTPYNRRMAEFSDDGGVTQPGAYGKRWRNNFTLFGEYNRDQLSWAIKRLRANPQDRRVVIQMWDSEQDPLAADAGGKDVPCNLCATPFVSEGQLNLTVFCRSNDILWGAYGANAVHFAFLLEYLAGCVGLPAGRYWQVSVNFHAYEERMPSGLPPREEDPYADYDYRPFALFQEWEMRGRGWEEVALDDLQLLFATTPRYAERSVRWPFLRRVVIPMMIAHQMWREGQGEARYTEPAAYLASACAAPDWRQAAVEWLARRLEKHRRAADDGVRAAEGG